MGTILDRGYVFKKGTALVPTFIAFAVTQLLEQHFDQLVDYDFTARMEDDLDRIAAGDEERVAWLTRFYFGDGSDPGLHALVTDHLDEIDARAVNSISIPGSDIVVRVGRYGPYLERGEQRASLARRHRAGRADARRGPRSCSHGRPAPSASSGSIPRRASDRRRTGRYGPVRDRGARREAGREATDGVALRVDVARDGHARRRAAAAVAAAHGRGASDGEEIVAPNGRYGPFIKKGSESRSLETEEQLFTLTVEEALALLAQPKQRRGRGAAAAAAPGARRRSREREADRRQGRPFRALRHGRRDEREPAPGDSVGAAHARASGRAARRKTR